MYSFNFPDMFNNGTTSILLADKDAVKSNIRLLFGCEKKELFGDPYFGLLLKQAIFAQANSVIVDLLIDEIYVGLVTYIPQIYLCREDIEITTDKINLYANVKYTYVADNTSDLYTIKLTSYEDFE